MLQSASNNLLCRRLLLTCTVGILAYADRSGWASSMPSAAGMSTPDLLSSCQVARSPTFVRTAVSRLAGTALQKASNMHDEMSPPLASCAGPGQSPASMFSSTQLPCYCSKIGSKLLAKLVVGLALQG